MKKTVVSIFLIALLAMFVFAHEEDEIAEGKKLVDSKVSCDQLNEDQLEAIGEYFMEQMHPGEQHELMHQMMGIKEDTPEHKAVHVHIARMMYCGQGYGMMGGMMPMMHGGMMGYRTGGMMGPGMMTWGSPWGSAWSILTIILFVGLFLLIWLGVIKLWKEVFGRKR